MKQVELKISGLVQGVFFRMHTQKKAKTLGLTGTVKNTDDGKVEIVAQGQEAALMQLISWCQKGPPSARVDNMESNWSEPINIFKDFKITH